MSIINCPNCNSENAGESVHCQVCGAPLQESVISKSVKSEDPLKSESEEAATPTPIGANQQSPAEEEKSAPDIARSSLTNEDDLDEWLRELPPPTTGEPGKRGGPRDEDGALPTWLQEVRATADRQASSSEPELVDWLTGLEGDDPADAATKKPDDDSPDWVSALTQPEKWPEADDPEAMAEWFANAEDDEDHILPQTAELPLTEPLDASRELDGIPEQLAGDSLPEWLMREAGEEDDLVSADYRPQERKPVISQTADLSGDEIGLVSHESEAKQDDPSEELPLDEEPQSRVDERNLAAAAVLDTADADEKFYWLEEFEDQEVEADLEESVQSEHEESDGPEIEGALEMGQLTDESVIEDPDGANILADTLLPAELENGNKEVESVQDEISLLGEVKIEDQGAEAALDEMILPEYPVDESPTNGSGDWLGYLDDAPEAEITDSLPEPALESDLELEHAEIPEWLRVMKPGESGRSNRRVIDEVEEELGPLTGLRGVIPVAVAATGTGQVAEPAKFEMTKEQQQQVALLKQLTLTLPERPRVETVTGEEDRFAAERLVLGLLLFLVVLGGWFLPVDRWLPFLSDWTVPETTKSAYQIVGQLGENTALLAFDYTPAMAGELDVIADSLLAELADGNSSVLTVSQAAAGVVMAQQAVERSDIKQSYDLGFLPGDAVGLRGLANCLSAGGECNSIVGVPLPDEAALLLEDVSLIIILTGDRDSLVNWVEQVGLQTEASMLAGITQSLGPVSAPYLASEQLVGIIEGAPAAAIYDYSSDGADKQNVQLLRSFTLAQWLVVAVMITGGLYFGLFKRSSKAAVEMDVR